MIVVARTGGVAVIHLEAAAAVARHHAETPSVECERIRADEDAAEGAAEARGIAVAAQVAPRAEGVAPHREATDGDRGISKAVVDGIADEAAVFQHRRAHREVQLARNPIESEARLIGRELQHRVIDRIAEAETFDTAAGGFLVRRHARIVEGEGVARHRQKDVVGVIAERGSEEREVRGHALGESPGAPTAGGEDRIGGGGCVVAHAGQDLKTE